MTATPTFSLGMFSAAGSAAFPGVVLSDMFNDRVIALRALEPLLPGEHGKTLAAAHSLQAVLQRWKDNNAALAAAVQMIREGTAPAIAAQIVPLAQLQVAAPIDPRQIFCSGANYRKHVVDLIVDQLGPETETMTLAERRAHGEKIMDARAANGKPFVFTKLPSSLTGPFDPILLPKEARQPDWELELGVVIGAPARRVSRANALKYVAGYVVVNDITSRDFVYRPDVPQMGMDWLACKSAPTYLPVGPYLVPAQFVPEPQNLQITLKLNGDTMQNESTADMIFSVARIIEFISSYVQLLPGDLICTGSPAGNGTHYKRFLQEGDVLEGSIAGLGTQRNACIAEK